MSDAVLSRTDALLVAVVERELAASREQAGAERAPGDVGQRLLRELLRDGVDGRVRDRVEDERGLGHQVRTPRGPGRGRGGLDGGHRGAQVAGRLGRPPERGPELAPRGLRRARCDRERGLVEPGALLGGEACDGVVGRPDRPRAGAVGLAVRGQLAPVPGDVREVLGEITGVPGLGGLGDRTVPGQPLTGGQRGLDGVAGQRVDEAVLAGPDLVDQSVRPHLVEPREARRHRLVERGGEEREREVATGDRRGLHETSAVGPEAVETGGDHVEHGARGPVGPPGTVGDRPRDLADEQRVPARDVEDGVRGRVVRAGGELGADLVDVEPVQVEALGAGCAGEVRQHPREQAARVGVPVGGDQQHAGPGHRRRGVLEDVQGGLVAAVDVVDDDHEPVGLPRRAQVGDDVLDDPEAVLGRRRVSRQHLDVRTDAAQHLAPRPERGRPRRLRAARPGHGRAAREGPTRELLGQPGLADPRLPRAEDETPRAGARRVEPALQELQLAGPTHQRTARGAHRQPPGTEGGRTWRRIASVTSAGAVCRAAWL